LFSTTQHNGIVGTFCKSEQYFVEIFIVSLIFFEQAYSARRIQFK
jgi:hypothetical protein